MYSFAARSKWMYGAFLNYMYTYKCINFFMYVFFASLENVSKKGDETNKIEESAVYKNGGRFE